MILINTFFFEVDSSEYQLRNPILGPPLFTPAFSIGLPMPYSTFLGSCPLCRSLSAKRSHWQTFLPPFDMRSGREVASKTSTGEVLGRSCHRSWDISLTSTCWPDTRRTGLQSPFSRHLQVGCRQEGELGEQWMRVWIVRVFFSLVALAMVVSFWKIGWETARGWNMNGKRGLPKVAAYCLIDEIQKKYKILLT